jgi:hypothetical protein
MQSLPLLMMAAASMSDQHDRQKKCLQHNNGTFRRTFEIQKLPTSNILAAQGKSILCWLIQQADFAHEGGGGR